jgi:hypothetical protein
MPNRFLLSPWANPADILELVLRESLSTNEPSGILDLLGPMSATHCGVYASSGRLFN